MHFYAEATPLCPAGAIPVVGSLCNAITGGIGNAASGAGKSLLGSGIGAIFDTASQWVATGAIWLLGKVGSAMSSTTSVGLGTNWFTAHESVMVSISAAVVLPMAFVGLIQAVYRQSASGLARSFLVHLPLALLLTGVSVELVRLGLSVTDTLSDKVLQAGGVDTSHLLTPVAFFLATGGATNTPGFVVFVVALLVAVSCLVLWLELIVRAAAVTAATLFLPLTLASLVWPAVSHWSRRLADTIAALVLSKFVVASVMSLAVGAIAGGLGTEGPSGGGIASAFTGLAMLSIAAVSPFTLLKLVPAVEAGAVAHLESARHRLTSAARAPARLALDLGATFAAPTGEAALAGSVGSVGSVDSVEGGPETLRFSTSPTPGPAGAGGAAADADVGLDERRYDMSQSVRSKFEDSKDTPERMRESWS
jgi:hypothetical protein